MLTADAAMTDPTPTAALVAALAEDLPAVLPIAAALALPGTLGVLVRLRRMLSRAQPVAPACDLAARGGDVLALPSAPASSFAIVDLRTEPCPREILEAGRDAWLRPWQAALVQAVAGLVFAAITTLAWRIANLGAPVRLSTTALVFWTFFWPAVIAANLVAGTTAATRGGAIAAYFSIAAAIAAFGLVRNPELAWRELALFWLLANATTSAVFLAFLARRLRAVGSVVFALALVVAAAVQIAFGGDATIAARLFATALVATALLYPLLFAIGALHARDGGDDQSLLVATSWVAFGSVYALAASGAPSLRAATGLAAVAGALVATRIGRDIVRRMRRAYEPKQLLLLRVTTALTPGESLFDALTQHWSHVGSVARVADGTALETHDLLGVIGGSRRADVRRRTLRELATHSDVVLMDLRRFGRAHFHSTEEIDRVLDATDLGRVVFVIADAADEGCLELALERCWRRLAPDSPNRRPGAHVARVVGDPTGSPAALRALLGVLAS